MTPDACVPHSDALPPRPGSELAIEGLAGFHWPGTHRHSQLPPSAFPFAFACALHPPSFAFSAFSRTTEWLLAGGGDCGLKAYEVVRFAIVSCVRGRQCSVGEGQSVPRGRGQGEKKLWRLGRGRERR